MTIYWHGHITNDAWLLKIIKEVMLSCRVYPYIMHISKLQIYEI